MHVYVHNYNYSRQFFLKYVIFSLSSWEDMGQKKTLFIGVKVEFSGCQSRSQQFCGMISEEGVAKSQLFTRFI